MQIPDEKWIEHFQTATRTAERVEQLYKILGNGGGLVQEVKDNRTHCDKQHVSLATIVANIRQDMRGHKIKWAAYSTALSAAGWVLWQGLTHASEIFKIWHQLHQ